MADMDLGLDLGLSLDDIGVDAAEMEKLAPETKVELAENLDGFANGFSADWDLDVPAEVMQEIAAKKERRKAAKRR